MSTVQNRKLQLISIILGLNDEQALARIEQEALRAQSKTDPYAAVKPIRSHVTLEQIMEEQQYERISYAAFRQQADELALKEPLEDLLKDLKP